uniref:Uncharacterized protein n=1 Tax=Anguilla anguilla TaxID=7936 RepID=A0A0E9RX61_ANGAN
MFGSGHPNGAAAIKGSFVQRLIVLRDSVFRPE